MARRTIPDAPGLRVPVQTRTTQELRDQLARAAEKSGRSIAQEVELRLERSFEFESLIKTAIDKSTSLAFKEFKKMFDQQRDFVERQEQVLINFVGGDDLFLFWSRLAWAIQEVEQEKGKSIRDDPETRDAAERAVLGMIPSLFRCMPEPYSALRERARSQPIEGGLASLAGLYPTKSSNEK